MKTFIAFLRGVNVGGAHSLPTKSLVELLQSLGLKNIRTYIQSGNAVFETNEKTASKLGLKIKEAIQEKFGFAPEVLLLPLEELEAAQANNPYPEADSNPRALHLLFFQAAPKKVDLKALASQAESERFTLRGSILYFYAPDGIGRSKLFPRVAKLLGGIGTARNWRTVCKVLEIARKSGS